MIAKACFVVCSELLRAYVEPLGGSAAISSVRVYETVRGRLSMVERMPSTTLFLRLI